MNKPRVMLIASHETRVMATDPWVVVLLIVIPCLLLAFFADGVVGGPARAVTGMAALFGFFGLSAIGLAFYRDHGWMTWDRLRTSGARPLETIAGKLAPLSIIFLGQYVVLLPLSWAVFGLPFRGSVAGAALIALTLVAVELGFGLLLSVICSGVNQLNALTSIAALLIVGVGGALSPVDTFPAWMRAIAPLSPVYWSLRGFQTVLTEDGGFTAVLLPAGVLAAMAAGCFVLALVVYDHEKRKTFFA